MRKHIFGYQYLKQIISTISNDKPGVFCICTLLGSIPRKKSFIHRQKVTPWKLRLLILVASTFSWLPTKSRHHKRHTFPFIAASKLNPVWNNNYVSDIMDGSEFEDDDEDSLHQFKDAPVYNFDLDEELMISDQDQTNHNDISDSKYTTDGYHTQRKIKIEDDNHKLEINSQMKKKDIDKYPNVNNEIMKKNKETQEYINSKMAGKVEDNVVNGNLPIEPGSVPLEQPKTKEDTPTQNHEIVNNMHSDVIVVATIDGTLAGLCRSTGKTLWKNKGTTQKMFGRKKKRRKRQESRKRSHSDTLHLNEKKAFENSKDIKALLAPLLSTTTTTSSQTETENAWRTEAIPSVGGRVYLKPGNDLKYRTPSSSSSETSQKADMTVTVSIQDLVQRAPFVDGRGRFYVGSRYASIAALNQYTGEVLKIFNGDQLGDTTFLQDFFKKNDNQDNERKLVWVGRIDYIVTVYDRKTEVIDVQFSASEMVSVKEIIGYSHPVLLLPGSQSEDNQNQDDKREYSNPPPSSPVSSHPIHNSMIVATPGGKLAMRDPQTRFFSWIANETFETPVAFALESRSGLFLDINLVPDAPMPNSKSKEYLLRELERQLVSMEQVQINNFHADKGGKAESRERMDERMIGALTSGQLFALSMGLNQPYFSRIKENQDLIEAPPRATIRPSHALTTHPPSHQVHVDIDLLQNKNNEAVGSILPKKISCDISSPSYPDCLLGTPIQSDNSNDWLLQPHSEAIMDYLIAKGHIESNQNKMPNIGKDNRKSKGYHVINDLVAPWIPLVAVCAIVISFQLGRKERARVENEVSNLNDSKNDKAYQIKESNENHKTSSLSTVPQFIDLVAESSQGSQKVGVIQMSDIILGYGGHGTVVYKGNLEGRNIAVKRMLKAYHASADREISLLIESDGHPNLVRYFLKEIQGDFVYLALELCDMSLQELIIALGKNKMKRMKAQQSSGKLSIKPSKTGVQKATKKLLFEIASGVQHIHSLRIVHRDLKPQNILLALKSKVDKTEKKNNICDSNSVYMAFEANNYVPKISDMGLGKQLTGQSSYGLSTINGSFTMRNGPGQDSSTIAGAGPGSVGWQAPEVMAQRWYSQSPDPASAQDKQNELDTMTEASPIEISLNIRTSRAVDIFSLGCIFYCTLLPGSHPFGEWYEREANIMKNKPTMDSLKEMSTDAADLVYSMIHRDPKARLTASQVCEHPFFWSCSKRLTFLCDISDRLESLPPLEENSTENYLSGINVLFCIEIQAASIVGTAWDKGLDADILNNVTRFRSYDTSSIRDCLRMIRNKHHHFDELSTKVKLKLGSTKEELFIYFETKFPELLMHCYITCCDQICADDPFASKYKLISRKNDFKIQQVSKETVTITAKKDESVSNNPFTLLRQISTDSIPENECEHSKAPTNQGGDLLHGSKAKTVAHLNALKIVSEDPEIVDEICSSQQSSMMALAASDDCKPSIVALEGNKVNVATILGCHGWLRSEKEWIHHSIMRNDSNVTRCTNDPKSRTRLCNHWDSSQGTFCSMQKKNKCIFAHGPIELRVKQGKKKSLGQACR